MSIKHILGLLNGHGSGMRHYCEEGVGIYGNRHLLNRYGYDCDTETSAAFADVNLPPNSSNRFTYINKILRKQDLCSSSNHKRLNE